MKDNFSFDKPTADILNSIKSELDFRSEAFKTKEILAFKEAMDKERQIF